MEEQLRMVQMVQLVTIHLLEHCFMDMLEAVEQEVLRLVEVEVAVAEQEVLRLVLLLQHNLAQMVVVLFLQAGQVLPQQI
jgi:hypothetical protein